MFKLININNQLLSQVNTLDSAKQVIVNLGVSLGLDRYFIEGGDKCYTLEYCKGSLATFSHDTKQEAIAFLVDKVY